MELRIRSRDRAMEPEMRRVLNRRLRLALGRHVARIERAELIVLEDVVTGEEEVDAMRLDELGQWVRKLATVNENENLVVSCYVDVTRGGPRRQAALVQRIATLQTSLPGTEPGEFEAAMERIESYLEHSTSPSTRGVAFFVRGGEEPFFIPLQFRTPFESWIGVERVPNIYQLVEMKDRFHRYVVMICGGESVRVLEVNLGAVTAELWRERPDLRRRVGREWTTQHYQRHEKAVTERFLSEAVDVLRQRMDLGGYRHLILVGNSVTLARVEAMLPKPLREVVVRSLVMGQRDRLQDVVDATLNAFLEAEEEESQSMVGELEHHLYKTGLAVAGAQNSLLALRTGAADVLVLSTHLDEKTREQLVRLAEQTSAQVELVEDNATLARLGGAGCLLRYRIPDAAFGALPNESRPMFEVMDIGYRSLEQEKRSDMLIPKVAGPGAVGGLLSFILAFASPEGALGGSHSSADPPAQTAATQAALTPNDALHLLKEGNERFARGEMHGRNLVKQVEQTAEGQYPFGVVLGCIDSRVPPELVFDQGIGDIFAPRIAGNFVNTDILGSMEFATAVAGSKVVVVLGHTSCGAVKGACDGVELGNLTAMLQRIQPAVDGVQNVDGDRSSKNAAFVQAVAEANVHQTVANILDRSEVMRGRVADGKLLLVGAMHDVATGRVSWFEPVSLPSP